jgi:hypothetical protein
MRASKEAYHICKDRTRGQVYMICGIYQPCLIEIYVHTICTSKDWFGDWHAMIYLHCPETNEVRGRVYLPGQGPPLPKILYL